jgi:hypothetical protein
MWDFNIMLLAMAKQSPSPSTVFTGIDVAENSTPEGKSLLLADGEMVQVGQAAQTKNPDSRITFDTATECRLLQDYATSIEGLSTGDNPRFTHQFWENSKISGGWTPFVQNTTASKLYSGRSDILFWEDGTGVLKNSPTAHNFPSEYMNGKQILGKSGLRISNMGDLPITLYQGEIFGKSAATVVPDNISHLPAIWAFCSSTTFCEEVRKIDQKLYVTCATFLKIPFDLEHWQKVAAEKYPNSLPKPHSDDPTQWLFNGHPTDSTQPLHVAVARLLGYRWPRQTGSSFLDCPALGLDGLEKLADGDGIVCLPSVRGEEPAAERLGKLLAAVYGKDWKAGTKLELLRATGSNASDLDEWLRNDFFALHCDLFHHRPFIWHIWDGRKRDGFHALVNYHRLAEGGGKGRQLLETLTYAYLGEWITRQRDDVQRGEAGADNRLVAALELQKRLIAILEGEPPFDLFVRWKRLGDQPIGWEPDINDGVRLNIRPFLASDLQNGKKGAGILRSKPNIKWEKDRGKEPHRSKDDFPWFWVWDGKSVAFMGGKEFTGERFNDCHYTKSVKQQARDREKDRG